MKNWKNGVVGMGKMVVIGALLAIPVCGQASTLNGTTAFGFGNSTFGATGSVSASANNSSSSASVNIGGDAKVKLINKTYPAVTVAVASTATKNSKAQATIQFSVGGYTVDSATKSASYNWGKSSSRTLCSASTVVTVGPIPVTLSGSVGGGGSVGLSLGLSSSTGLTLGGDGSVWANGSAAAGLGVPWEAGGQPLEDRI